MADKTDSTSPLGQLRKAFVDWDQDEATAPSTYEIYRAVSRILEVTEPWAESGASLVPRPDLAARLLPLVQEATGHLMAEKPVDAVDVLAKILAILREPIPEGGEADLASPPPTRSASKRRTKMALAPHQKRVVEERDELEARIQRLSDFCDTEVFDGLDAGEHFRLMTQARFMAGYLATVKARIAHFVPR